jgi:hypothetical protein
MRRPRAQNTRKPTDENQVDNEAINPPVFPEIAKLEKEKARPGKYGQKTLRVGRT